nr:4'-phosphopantetheinyl transferase [uncultured bacterium]
MTHTSVDIWEARLDVSPPDIERVWPWLSPAERRRADGFAFARDHRRYVVTRGALRSVLGGLLGRFPGDVLLDSSCPACGDGHGRPRLAGPDARLPWRFSISHSADVALIAVCGTGDVGVDVEVVPPGVSLETLPLSACSADEQRRLEALPREQAVAGFYASWARKEAYLKGCGVGLTVDPASVELLPVGAQVHRASQPGCSQWLVADVAVPGAAAAVAAPCRRLTVRRHRAEIGRPARGPST